MGYNVGLLVAIHVLMRVLFFVGITLKGYLTSSNRHTLAAIGSSVSVFVLVAVEVFWYASGTSAVCLQDADSDIPVAQVRDRDESLVS